MEYNLPSTLPHGESRLLHFLLITDSVLKGKKNRRHLKSAEEYCNCRFCVFNDAFLKSLCKTGSIKLISSIHAKVGPQKEFPYRNSFLYSRGVTLYIVLILKTQIQQTTVTMKNIIIC